MTDSETVQASVLPIEQRISTFVVRDSIVKIVEEDKFTLGHTTVELKAYAEIPEYTPEDFQPSNDLETFLYTNKVAATLSVTMPFSFALRDMVRGLAFNVRNFERRYDCEISTSMRTPDGYIEIEFISHKLKRSLYVKMTPHLNS